MIVSLVYAESREKWSADALVNNFGYKYYINILYLYDTMIYSLIWTTVNSKIAIKENI